MWLPATRAEVPELIGARVRCRRVGLAVAAARRDAWPTSSDS